MMKKIWIILVLSAIVINGYGQELQKSVDLLASSKKVVDGRFSFYAFNLSTGKTVVVKNKNQKMIPASTLKLLTAYAALDNLGVDHQFSTFLDYTGSINEQGVLHGDIIIRGGGDPVFGSEKFKNHYEAQSTIVEQMIEAIVAAGIKEINGQIIGDDSYYQGEPYPSDWVWEDVGNYYGAAALGLTYRENKLNLYFNSSSKVGAVVTLDSTSSLVSNVNYKIFAKGAKINSDQIYVYSPAYADYANLRGEMPLSKSKFKVKASMQDPALYLANELKLELEKNRIRVSGDNTTIRAIEFSNKYKSEEAQNIWQIRSPKLMEIVNYMNLVSNNLVAEHLMKQLSINKGDGSGSTVDGVKVVMNWLSKKGIETSRLRIKDGSGLSHTNLVTTSWFVRLLAKMSMEPWFEDLKSELPTAGVSGSMRRIGKGTGIAKNMKAKTGYIDGVRSFVGYVANSAGEDIAFCIIANDYACSVSEMRKEMEKLMIDLY